MASYLSDLAERGIIKWILVAVNSNHQKNKAFAQDLFTQLEITDFDLSDRNIR